MLTRSLASWWRVNRNALIWGLASGALWGFLAAASTTPREWLVYDMLKGVVYKYREPDAVPIAVTAESFFDDFYSSLVKVVLTFLILVSLAGWATWQLSRIRPRHEEQPPLGAGVDWYLIGLAVGGLICVWLFRAFGLAVWFKGSSFTPIAAINAALGIMLPLYMGVSLFLVWFLRLKSIRAPDWETHYPNPRRRPAGTSRFKLFRRKGGDATET